MSISLFQSRSFLLHVCKSSSPVSVFLSADTSGQLHPGAEHPLLLRGGEGEEGHLTAGRGRSRRGKRQQTEAETVLQIKPACVFEGVSAQKQMR